MITVNANYTNLRNAGANIEWRIQNGSNTFTKANLITGKISSGLMENVSIGNCISAELDLELWGVTVDSTNPLVVQFRATQVGTTLPTTWFTKGTFYIDTLEKNPYTENTSVKAFDAMLKTEVGYMASGVWANPTDKAVVDNIVADLGISLESATNTTLTNNPITLTNAPHIGENGTTDREMLSYIAMLRGGNWVITSANELKLIYPSTTPTNTAQVDKAVVNFAASETLTVSKVKVNVDSETYYLAPSNITEDAWKALAGYCIEITLPFYGTQTVADDLLTQYDTKTFIPFQAEGAYVDPKYEVGDGVRFQKDSTYYTTVIANQTITIDSLCASDLYLKDEEKLQSLYPYLSPRERQTLYQFGELEDAVDTAQSAANAAQASADGANYREQIIYISKPSGTNTVSANTTWVTDATGNQNTWTTTRPVYNSSYPVLFVATQRQSVSQSSGTTCTCTTPVKDETTTVIDGGHITTGTIDCNNVNVTNINASNITSGTINAININGSTITGSTLESTSANGSIKIANGEVDFFQDANTSATPFSTLAHVYNSGLNQHAIEWHTTGYTKLINDAGGQWTGDFIQFALNPASPTQALQLYPDSDGYHARFLTDFVETNSDIKVNGNARIIGDGSTTRGIVFSYDSGATIPAQIVVAKASINGIYHATRINQYIYSYNSTTGEILNTYEYYRMPTVTKDLAASATYNILTSKYANKSLWSGTLTSTATAIANGYDDYIHNYLVIGKPTGAGHGKSTVTIPKSLIPSSDPSSAGTDYWQITDEQYYSTFYIWHDGSTLYIKLRQSSGSSIVTDVYALC